MIPVLMTASVLTGAAGAVGDVLHRRLPNWLCLLVAIVCAAWTALSLGLPDLGWAALHAVCGLLVGMALFAMGAIGAGDAKFYAALAFAVPIDRGLAMIGWMSAAGLGMLVIMMIGRRIGSARASSDEQWTVPYGVAIYLGFIGAIWPRILP